MAYQTVLVHLDLDAHCATRVAWGAALAAPGGVLIGAAMSGVSRLHYRSTPEPGGDQYLALHLAFLRERATAALDAFTQRMDSAGSPAFDARLVDDEASAGLALQARIADVLVLSQPEDGNDLVTQVLPQAGRPVLVLPAAQAPAGAVGLPRRILVAWDASREAGRALASALPLLRQAELVELVVCATDPDGRVARDVQMADPLAYLARHGVRATLRHHTLAGGGLFKRDAVGAALLAVAADDRFDLMVMGAYAHSRLRETFLGGATRTVLSHMALPVLLEH
jgi:nucleotide-binding universal stress UspA family protein